jgi:hypothetical protein
VTRALDLAGETTGTERALESLARGLRRELATVAERHYYATSPAVRRVYLQHAAELRDELRRLGAEQARLDEAAPRLRQRRRAVTEPALEAVR